jgi:hypothetical protein
MAFFGTESFFKHKTAKSMPVLCDRHGFPFVRKTRPEADFKEEQVRHRLVYAMKTSVLLFPAACALLSGCSDMNWSGHPAVKGSGKLASEVRPVSDFDRVLHSGSGHLSIVQGEQESLTIETDDNLLPLIESRVADHCLHIGPEHANLRPTQTIQYRLQLKNLKELHLSGSLEADAPSLSADQLALRISGSGKIQIPKLETKALDVRVSGSGDIELAGKADRQTVSISGSGDYRAGNCEGNNVNVNVSGSGDATVWARLTLDAQVSGSGDIKYYGSPQINSHVSGAGGLHTLGNK